MPYVIAMNNPDNTKHYLEVSEGGSKVVIHTVLDKATTFESELEANSLAENAEDNIRLNFFGLEFELDVIPLEDSL